MTVNRAPLDPVNWLGDAACRNLPTALFFPEQGARPTHAVAVCGTCPVKARCLHQAILDDDEHGVFGGHAEASRRRLRSRIYHETKKTGHSVTLWRLRTAAELEAGINIEEDVA